MDSRNNVSIGELARWGSLDEEAGKHQNPMLSLHSSVELVRLAALCTQLDALRFLFYRQTHSSSKALTWCASIRSSQQCRMMYPYTKEIAVAGAHPSRTTDISVETWLVCVALKRYTYPLAHELSGLLC